MCARSAFGVLFAIIDRQFSGRALETPNNGRDEFDAYVSASGRARRSAGDCGFTLAFDQEELDHIGVINRFAIHEMIDEMVSIISPPGLNFSDTRSSVESIIHLIHFARRGAWQCLDFGCYTFAVRRLAGNLRIACPIVMAGRQSQRRRDYRDASAGHLKRDPVFSPARRSR